MDQADIVIIGAGAAGLFAAIWAGRANSAAKILTLDGARRIGAKILISGGGRCNITHESVDEKSFAGSTPAAIRKVLRRFGVDETTKFFETEGVQIKQESTGKLFPVSDRAQTVLNALLHAAETSGVRIETSRRVETVKQNGNLFIVSGNWGMLTARKVILSTGGKSVPETGSDGHGYQIATSLGHTITTKIMPALVPLILPEDHLLTALSGISTFVKLDVCAGTGRVLKSFSNSMLCTHFGLSGPAILDISRYWIEASQNDPNASLRVNWVPAESSESVDAELKQLRGLAVFTWLRRKIPDRLARALCEHSDVVPETIGSQLTREQRNRLVQTICNLKLPVIGDRGFRFAEVTAGGIPLNELDLNTMESKKCPGVYLCGEICDVDGRIGGFNFQWAWSSGYVAGISAAVP